MFILGDCLEKLKDLESNSIDSIVTDPPYGLSFMGKKWDYDVPSVEIWREALRVLKPGGHLLSFGGTRTYHRLVVNIEDAGFEIRDQIQWIYGSGFPKSLDVSKAMDKAAGAERESGTPQLRPDGSFRINTEKSEGSSFASGSNDKLSSLPSTPLAKKWQGWGTALKPANEPICVARKPLEGTVAANVEKWGTGAINVDGSRIGTEMIQGGRAGRAGESSFNVSIGEKPPMHQGRWPANVIFDEEAAAMLDEQTGVTKGGGKTLSRTETQGSFGLKGHVTTDYADSGGASRFFYCAKASKKERNAGCEGMPEVVQGVGDERPSGQSMQRLDGREPRSMANHHPTVKPLKLMEYLVRLVTPPNGTVLDPFMGSGSTGVAAKNLGFNFVGVEMNEEYFEIAKTRVV